MAIMGAGLLGAASGVQAATITAGDWELSFGGNINAFFSVTQCDASDLGVTAPGAPLPFTYAGIACVGATDENGNFKDTASVQNGLLPASLNFTAATMQEGWDISGTINVYYGIVSNTTDGAALADTPDALKFSSVDARQVFMSFGKDNVGSFKLGRDFGLFGFDAIINDMTLLGSGAILASADPGHTTFGGLGWGYVYTDRLTQMNYTTPEFGGCFSGTLGIFQAFDGNGARSASSPGFHGKASCTWSGPVSGTVSGTFLTQKVITDANTKEDIKGFDVFGKVSVNAGGDLGLLGYYYDAEGMTALAIGGLLLPGFAPITGTPEDVQGGYLQATWTPNAAPKWKFGINWSKNEHKTVVPHENMKIGVGIFYSLTPALTLVGEYSKQESELDASLGGAKDETSNFNLGAILFF